ncbi:MAG: rhodanese-like domain-containing protein [Candidatus Omnitrophica bacterium]|nr:rhodanese-like domain-containing protein [Candidatus Omnitrophota bacterium]
MTKSISVIIVAFFLFFASYSQAQEAERDLQEKSYSDINASELMRKIERKEEFVLLDVRTEDEYAQGYIKGAISIPYREIDVKTVNLGCPCREVVIYSKSGHRSANIGKSLAGVGFVDVKNLLGGIQAWKKTGGKIVKGDFEAEGRAALPDAGGQAR